MQRADGAGEETMQKRQMRRWNVWTSGVCAVALLGLLAAPAAALKLDFEEFDHGEKVFSSKGVDIIVDNARPKGADFGVAFDTMETLTEDEDLEMGNGWSGGNLAPDTVLDNILIIQEHDKTCNTTMCERPDDEGSRPAGDITLDYRKVGPFKTFAFDFVDVENVKKERGALKFYLGGVDGTLVDQIFFAEFAGVTFGDNHANHVDLGEIGHFDTVVIEVGGSAGFDNITTTVPEPTTATLVALGLLGLAMRGRRTEASR